MDSRLVDKADLQRWRNHSITRVIWARLLEHYNPQAWRSCDIEKIEYHRGQAEIMDELEKLFADKTGESI